MRLKNSWIIVTRREYSVRTIELTRSGYQVFTALCSGKPLGRALSGVRVGGPVLKESFKT